MKKINKKQLPFAILSILMILFFSTIIILNLPTIFKFKSIESKIEKIFFTEFKLYLDIEGNIDYKALPVPHLLISKGKIDLYGNNRGNSFSDFTDMKIFIPINQLFIKKVNQINKVELNSINLKLKPKDITELRNHLYSKINKRIIINDSNIFILNNNDKNILISPIKKINYFLDIKNKTKKLEISGNIFDIDFFSEWERDYLKPETTYHSINLDNLKIQLKNYLTILNNKHFKGGTEINFLNEKFILDYEYLKNKIQLSSPENKSNNLRVFADINFNPFYFESKIEIYKKNLNFIIENVMKHFFIYDKDLLGNISGKILIKFINLDNSIIKNGEINLYINEKNINVLNTKFDFDKVGILNSELNYIIKNDETYFYSKNELDVISNKELIKFLQFNSKEIKKVKKIFFELSKKINNQEIMISNIRLIDNLNTEYIIEKSIKAKNIQNLKYEIRKKLN
tara:strand:- start:975 stop:2345 length:1371 start_codon:yes stop_codon:yes gene_type:complete